MGSGLAAGWKGRNLNRYPEAVQEWSDQGALYYRRKSVGHPTGFDGSQGGLGAVGIIGLSDPFLTETARLAHIVLPACTYAEKEGTFTNLEGKVLRIRQAMDPIGESLPDWHIMTAIASGLGCQFEYESPYDIQREIMKLVPGYYNLGQPRKVTPNPERYLSDGYKAEVSTRYQANAASAIAGAKSFALSLGQLLYHSGKLSTQAPGLLTIAPNSHRLHMNDKDMERLGLKDGAKVRMTTAQGKLDIGVQADLAILPGSVFLPGALQ